MTKIRPKKLGNGLSPYKEGMRKIFFKNGFYFHIFYKTVHPCHDHWIRNSHKEQGADFSCMYEPVRLLQYLLELQ